MVIYRLRLCVLVLCASLQAFCKQAATLQGLDNPTRQLQQDASKNPAEELTLAQISGKWVGLTFPLVEVGGLACLSEACRESIPTKVVFEISGDRLVYDGLLGDAVAANEQTCLTAGANERFEGRIKDFSESRLYVDFSFQEVDLKTSDANGDPILAAFDLSVADVELSCVKMKVVVEDGIATAGIRMENSYKGTVEGFMEKTSKDSAEIFQCFEEDVPSCNIDLENPSNIALEIAQVATMRCVSGDCLKLVE